jgi:hypothetical protein
MPMDSMSMCSNTLNMSNVDVGSSLSWLSASQIKANLNMRKVQKRLVGPLRWQPI